MDAGGRVVTVQVEVHYHGRGQTRVQLSPAQAQPAEETKHHQDGAVDGQERSRHHGVPPSVSHHPNYTGPHQHGKSQPVVVGDTPHLKTHIMDIDTLLPHALRCASECQLLLKLITVVLFLLTVTTTILAKHSKKYNFNTMSAMLSPNSLDICSVNVS